MGLLAHTAVILGFYSLVRVTWCSFLGRPTLGGPGVSLVGKIEVFRCVARNATVTEAILYELFQGNNSKVFGESTAYDGHTANFSLLVQLDYEGYFFCRASVQNSSSVPATVSEAHFLKVIEPVAGVELESEPPSGEVFKGRSLMLTCTVRQGTHVTYQWSHNGTTVGTSRQYETQAALEDAGNYSCLARNQLNHTRVYSASNHILVRVKVPVSKPKISLAVHKANDGYSANVTCWVDEGTPPVNFTLKFYNQSRLPPISQTRGSLSTSFAFPVSLNRPEGKVQCQATNGDRRVDGDTLSVEMVPVGGAVTLTSEQMKRYLRVVGLALHCSVERGSFPTIRWFLNDSLFGGEVDFSNDGEKEQTLLLMPVTAGTSGFYHCVATDSFDETNSVSSDKLWVDKKAMQLVSIGTLAVVLGCFFFLVCLVTSCCVYGAIYRRRPSSAKPRPALISTEAGGPGSEDEEPVEEEYMEDVELVKTANIDYPEKSEEESVDEWPDIERALQTSCMDEGVLGKRETGGRGAGQTV